MSSNDAYEKLMSGLGFSGSARLRGIMEELMTGEQAQMVAALPASPAEVAEKTGLQEEAVQETLDALALSGVVYPKGGFGNHDYFYFTRHATGLLDGVLISQQLDPVKDKAALTKWHDFCINEMLAVVGKQMSHIQTAPLRIVPAYKAIEDLPDVEPHEDFRELLKAQERISIIPCPCRQRTEAVGESCEYTNEADQWQCLQFGRGTDDVMGKGVGKEISLDEALEILEKIESDGLLHTWPNNNEMAGAYASCQCCLDCCLAVLPLTSIGESVGKVWAKSRFEAVIDQEKCDGCQDCVERCQFDAIDMVPPGGDFSGNGRRKSKKLKAHVDPEKCWGCGVCVIACDETKALGFKAVRPLEHIPART